MEPLLNQIMQLVLNSESAILRIVIQPRKGTVDVIEGLGETVGEYFHSESILTENYLQ